MSLTYATYGVFGNEVTKDYVQKAHAQDGRLCIVREA